MVLSPKIINRPHLCTVVTLSTTAPDPIMSYHRQINLDPILPLKYQSQGIWIKGDMVNAVGFHRLNLIFDGKNDNKRNYLYEGQIEENIKIARQCVLRALGMSVLTKHM